MASTTGALVSVEDYLARTEKPNAEYENGILYPKPMPSFAHSDLEYIATDLLRRQGARAFPELTFRVGPTRFLIPDVAVVARVEGDYLTEAPILCIEILSPEQRLGEMLAKCEQYHTWGVPYCWVIDPEKRTAWEYHKNGEPVKAVRNSALRAGDLSVALEELFSGLPA
jgi:Uma2 family endonuclease